MPRDNDNSCDYYEGTQFEVWLGAEPITCDAPTPTQYFMQASSLGFPGDPRLALGIPGSSYGVIPKKIPNGRRLRTSGGQVLVFDATGQATDAITGIKYVPSPGTDAGGRIVATKPMAAAQILEIPAPGFPGIFYTTITYEDMLLLFSVNDVKYDLSWETLSFQNAGSDEELMARTTKKIAFSLSGHKVKGDTMNQLIEKCVDNPHLRLKCLYIDPSNEAREMYLHVTKESASAKIKTPFDVSYDFVYAGGYKRYDLTPS
jgi:hypothetical protein